MRDRSSTNDMKQSWQGMTNPLETSERQTSRCVQRERSSIIDCRGVVFSELIGRGLGRHFREQTDDNSHSLWSYQDNQSFSRPAQACTTSVGLYGQKSDAQ